MNKCSFRRLYLVICTSVSLASSDSPQFPARSQTQVGVQTMIEPNAGATALEDKVNAAHPILVGSEEAADDQNDKDE